MNTFVTKTGLGLVLIFLLLQVSCEKIEYYHEDGSEITNAEALEIVQPIIEKYIEEQRFVLISKDPVQPETTLKYGPYGEYNPTSKYCGTIKSPGFRSWLIVIGPDRFVDGQLKQLHLFVNTKTGDYKEVFIDGQVTGIEWDESYNKEAEFDPSFWYPWLTKSEFKKTQRSVSSTSGLYAVIISGGKNRDYNYSQYWFDCQHIYLTLTQTLGYDESHIYCLVSDGTDPGLDVNVGPNLYFDSPLDFDDDGDDDIQYAATKANISTVFNLLQSQSASIDHLLVFVTDHGTSSGNICLWGNNQEMSPSELAAELDKVAGVRMDIVMGQCFSGAFISPLTDYNRTIATACSSVESANGNGSYSFFLHWWTDAFDPTNASIVDTNSDNMISLREAFVYAFENDPAAISDDEHPQYASLPLIYGYTHDLQGADNRPVISGSNYVSCNFSSVYTISGLPSSASVTWQSVGDLNLSSPTNTSVSAQGNLTSTYVSLPAAINAYFTLEGTLYHVTKEIYSVWKPGYYSGPSFINGGSGHYAVVSGPGAYGYQWASDNPAWVVLNQGSAHVDVQESSTIYPVTLIVAFQDPWGNGIVVSKQFN